MITFLNTAFSQKEQEILSEYIIKYNVELSIVYSADMDKLSGVNCPNRMIYIGSLYLLEEKDELQEWYMGQKVGDTYDFWGNYGDLKNALYGL